MKPGHETEFPVTPHLLVVDDDEGITKLISKELSRHGVQVETCRTGSDALAKLDEMKIDLLLLDYKLPDMTGKELIDHLNKRKQAVPFIMITGRGDEKVAVEMMKAGAQDYLVKDQSFLDLVPTVVKRAFLQTTLENELERVEAGLEKSQRRYETLVQLSPNGIFHADPDGKCSYINRRGSDILGQREEKCLGDGWANALHPEDREWVWQAWHEAVKKQDAFNVECRFASNGSKTHWAIAHAMPEFDSRGELVAYVGTLADVTELKKTELKLRQAKEELDGQKSLLESILTCMGEGVAVTDCEGQFLHFNPAAERILGLGPGQVDPEKWSEAYGLYYPNKEELIPTSELPLIRAMAGEEREPMEMFVQNDQKKQGVFIKVTCRPLKNNNNELIGAVSAFTDITKLKYIQERLKESELKYRRLFEESKDAVFMSTLDGKLIDINSAGVELFGYDSKQELMQVEIGSELYFNPEERKSLLQKLKRDGYVKDYPLTLRKKNGEKMIVQESGVPVRNKWGNIIYYQGIIHDITERIELERQLMQAQKMETLGTLAGGIAHDFNNLLLVILGNVEFALQDMNSKDKLHNDLLKIEDAAKQSRDLIKQILSFSKQDGHNPDRVDLNGVIKETLEMLRRVIGRNIRLRTRLSDNLNEIYADPVQIQQVLMNLCINSRDAMPDGGNIEIRTWNVDAVTIDNSESNEATCQYVHLQIRDTGVGMDKETQQKIFDPYFTTKEAGQGTGLGLSVVYGIVKTHGGQIEVNSKEGDGTTFDIYLPSVNHVHVIGGEDDKGVGDRRPRQYQADRP